MNAILSEHMKSKLNTTAIRSSSLHTPTKEPYCICVLYRLGVPPEDGHHMVEIHLGF